MLQPGSSRLFPLKLLGNILLRLSWTKPAAMRGLKVDPKIPPACAAHFLGRKEGAGHEANTVVFKAKVRYWPRARGQLTIAELDSRLLKYPRRVAVCLEEGLDSGGAGCPLDSIAIRPRAPALRNLPTDRGDTRRCLERRFLTVMELRVVSRSQRRADDWPRRTYTPFSGRASDALLPVSAAHRCTLPKAGALGVLNWLS